MKFSLTRAKILSIISKNAPINVTNLSKLVGISKGTTIYRYLEELKQRGLITIKKENKKRGKPTMISITQKARPFKLQNIEKLEKMWECLK